MIEGLGNDDRYRVVEDEFLVTAQQFTAHLHAAEYHRLKAASKLENADTIRDISRPVVGRMTDLVKKKQERQARLEKQRLATRKALANNGGPDDTDGDDGMDSWQSASLYGLMESPRKQATRLDSLMTTNTASRAAAGFGGARARLSASTYAMPQPKFENLPGSRHGKPVERPMPAEDDDTDDDLEAPANKSTANVTQAVSLSKPEPVVSRTAPPLERQMQPSLPLSKVTSYMDQLAAPHTAEEDDSSAGSGLGILGSLRSRQAERRRSREQRKHAARS